MIKDEWVGNSYDYRPGRNAHQALLRFEKTVGNKIVYCRDYRRKEKYPVVKFDFLGYSFQPRTAFSKKLGKLFIGYDCAISISSRKRIADKLEELNVNKLSFKSIVGVGH